MSENIQNTNTPIEQPKAQKNYTRTHLALLIANSLIFLWFSIYFVSLFFIIDGKWDLGINNLLMILPLLLLIWWQIWILRKRPALGFYRGIGFNIAAVICFIFNIIAKYFDWTSFGLVGGWFAGVLGYILLYAAIVSLLYNLNKHRDRTKLMPAPLFQSYMFFHLSFLLAYFLVILMIALVVGYHFPKMRKDSVVYSPTGEQQAWIADYFCIDPPAERLFFHDGNRRKSLEKLKADWDVVNHLQFTFDGKYLVVMINSGVLLVYDGKTGEEIQGRFAINGQEDGKLYPPSFPIWRWDTLYPDNRLKVKSNRLTYKVSKHYPDSLIGGGLERVFEIPSLKLIKKTPQEQTGRSPLTSLDNGE